MIVGTQQVSSKKADKKDAEDNFDINELLDDLRKVIIKVYLSALDPKADLAAKNTVDIFTDIELQLEEKIKQLKQIESIGEAEEKLVKDNEKL
jgi:hypothetical protein